MTVSTSNVSAAVTGCVGNCMNIFVFTVMKFKQRPRFLEFFTHIMLRCINDEKFHLALEITAPVYDFMKRYVFIGFVHGGTLRNE